MKSAAHEACDGQRYVDLSLATLQKRSEFVPMALLRISRQKALQVVGVSPGGVGERLKPPVLKTGAHTVGRGFESRPLRQ
jgi:hypothetical protein